jgi:glutathione S-transferase
MIELIQFPWSPFCLAQKRILEYSGVRFKVLNVPNGDRSQVWRLTRQRYYQVPVIKDGKTVVFETDDDSQVIAKYLDNRLNLGLFPKEWGGIQPILWRYIEREVEDVGFKLNDIYWLEFVPPSDQLRFLRHKERKFGRGCLDQWRRQQDGLLQELSNRLIPFEQMLATRAFLLDSQPRFVDFDLYGILANFLYSGHYELPVVHSNLKLWFQRMADLKATSPKREKLHS